VCIVNVPVGSMSRYGLMGSWLNVISGCVQGVGPGSGRMGFVEETKRELNAERAVGPKGVSPMVSWSCRQGAHAPSANLLGSVLVTNSEVKPVRGFIRMGLSTVIVLGQ
jgi:hypothetical protein